MRSEKRVVLPHGCAVAVNSRGTWKHATCQTQVTTIQSNVCSPCRRTVHYIEYPLYCLNAFQPTRISVFRTLLIATQYTLYYNRCDCVTCGASSLLIGRPRPDGRSRRLSRACRLSYVPRSHPGWRKRVGLNIVANCMHT